MLREGCWGGMGGLLREGCWGGEGSDVEGEELGMVFGGVEDRGVLKRVGFGEFSVRREETGESVSGDINVERAEGYSAVQYWTCSLSCVLLKILKLKINKCLDNVVFVYYSAEPESLLGIFQRAVL